MAVRIHKGQALDTINMTPLIDVVFQLLIFFLVATRFAQEDREMEMPLPTASEARPLTEQPRSLFVNIDREGRTFIDGQLMSRAEVEQVLLRAKANNPVGQTVVIRADKRVAFDHPVGVMNVCNKVGLPYTVNAEGE